MVGEIPQVGEDNNDVSHDFHCHRQTDKQMDGQTGRQNDRTKDRQINKDGKKERKSDQTSQKKIGNTDKVHAIDTICRIDTIDLKI